MNALSRAGPVCGGYFEWIVNEIDTGSHINLICEHLSAATCSVVGSFMTIAQGPPDAAQPPSL